MKHLRYSHHNIKAHAHFCGVIMKPKLLNINENKYVTYRPRVIKPKK